MVGGASFHLVMISIRQILDFTEYVTPVRVEIKSVKFQSAVSEILGPGFHLKSTSYSRQTSAGLYDLKI